MADSLWPHRLQHTKICCHTSLSPGVCSNSFLLSWWYHLNISSPVLPFSSCPQSFPSLRSFPMSQLFTSGGQSIGASASAPVLLTNTQDWFHLGLAGLISMLSKGLSRIFSNTTIWKHQFFSTQPFLWSNSHIHTWLLKKTIALTIRTFVAKWCLCFLILCLGLSKLSFQGVSVF